MKDEAKEMTSTSKLSGRKKVSGRGEKERTSTSRLTPGRRGKTQASDLLIGNGHGVASNPKSAPEQRWGKESEGGRGGPGKKDYGGASPLLG